MAISFDPTSATSSMYHQGDRSDWDSDPEIIALRALMDLTKQLGSDPKNGHLRKDINSRFKDFQTDPSKNLLRKKVSFSLDTKIESNHLLSTRKRSRDDDLLQELLPKLQKISPLMDFLDLSSCTRDEDKADLILEFLKGRPKECSEIKCITFDGTIQEYLPKDKKVRQALVGLFPNLSEIKFLIGRGHIYFSTRRS